MTIWRAQAGMKAIYLWAVVVLQIGMLLVMLGRLHTP